MFSGNSSRYTGLNSKIKIFAQPPIFRFMNNAFLLIGGNLGNVSQNLEQAKARISRSCGEIVALSAVYQTAAWGKTDQPDFLNQALQITTELSPMELLQELLQIEREMGRERLEKYGPRIMDIDIIFYDQQILDLKDLTVPHPQMANRRFVLAPLAEIAPNFNHPVLDITVSELLSKCSDSSHVDKKNDQV